MITLNSTTPFPSEGGPGAYTHTEVPSPCNEPTVLLYRERGITPFVIKWQTRSIYNHASIKLPDGRVIESRGIRGVRVAADNTNPLDMTYVDEFRVKGVDVITTRSVTEFLEAQIGKGYDYLAILRFLSRRRHNTNKRWFCSELVFAAFARAGIPLLHRIEAWAVSPALLANSPLLHPVINCDRGIRVD